MKTWPFLSGFEASNENITDWSPTDILSKYWTTEKWWFLALSGTSSYDLFMNMQGYI